MTNIVIAVGPDWWGSGIAAANKAGQVAEHAARHAQGGADSVADLAHIAPAALVALALGLALWLVGDRLFRPVASLVGAVLGALIGLVIAGQVHAESLGGVPAPYAAIGIGALVGLGVGALMYRLAVGIAGGLTLAGVAGVIAACVMLQHPAPGVPERPETRAEAAALRPVSTHAEPVDFADSLSISGLRTAATSVGDLAAAQWQAVPDEARSLILAGSILGCVFGFAFGVIRPRTAGPAVAALAGSALWLAGATSLLARTGRPLPPLPAEQPGPWLAAWLLVALVGFAVQRRVIRPAALVERDRGHD